MKHEILILSVLVGAGTAGAAVGAPTPPAMAPMATHPTAVRSGHGVGTVKAINMRTGTVTIQHGPIAAVGWLAMTMTFKVRQPTMLRKIAPGQKIDFDMTTDGASAQVTAIMAR